MMKRHLLKLLRYPLYFALLATILLAACTASGGDDIDVPATATLAPIVSRTPRYTATPIPTRTPIPTFTFTPSVTPIPPTPTLSPTATPKPPLIGIISGVQAINVREGPGTTFRAFTTLNPGSGVEVLGQNQGGDWYNVRLEDGSEGWVSAALVRLESTPTPFPTATPSPDLTSIALGTPLPTAILGGGTITPTPPRAAVTPTPVGSVNPADIGPESTAESAPEETPEPLVPIIDFDAINATATALAGGVVSPTPEATETSVGNTTIPAPTSAAPPPRTPSQTTSSGPADVQEGVEVLAVCDDPRQGNPPPSNLAAGSTIEIWWTWFARTPEQVQDHLSAATYEVRLDGILLTNIDQYRTRIIQRSNGDYAVYWYVPAGPLSAGEHRITYRVTWSRQITDGYQNFGPGTNTLVEEGSCTFTVQ